MSVRVQAHRVRSPLSTRLLARVAEHVLRAERASSASISITLVSASRIAMLNALHLGVDGPTDVIAFALSGVPGEVVMGDVYIAPSVARRNARHFGTSAREEVARLAVHGVLHVLGHDHPEGSARERSPMWRRQERLLKYAGISSTRRSSSPTPASR